VGGLLAVELARMQLLLVVHLLLVVFVEWVVAAQT